MRRNSSIRHSDRHEKIKHIAGFAAFMLILVFLFCKATWVMRGNDSDARMTVYGFDNEDKLDVVLFGGSDLLKFYDPLSAYHKYGFTSYDYGTSSGTIYMQLNYLKESRATYKAPLYVFSIRTLIFDTEEIEVQTLRNWSDSLSVFSPHRIYGITRYLTSGKNLTDQNLPSYYFDIMKYHTAREKLAEPSQWEYLKKDYIRNVVKGYHPSAKRSVQADPVLSNDRTDLTPRQIKALDEILDYCDSQDINALFIVPPFMIYDSDSAIMNSAGDYITDRGYDYINFTEHYNEIGLDFSNDYSDSSHVNATGAAKFTDWFSQYLVKNYDLPDHRDDTDYAAWDDCYEVWKELYGNIEITDVEEITEAGE